MLDVTEVNGFKKLVHLSIRLNQADESNVRKNMITTLTRLKVMTRAFHSRFFATPLPFNGRMCQFKSCSFRIPIRDRFLRKDRGALMGVSPTIGDLVHAHIFQNDKDRLEEALRSTESKLHDQQTKYERQLESQRMQIEKMKTDFEHDMNQLRSRVSLEVRRDTDGLNRVSSESSSKKKSTLELVVPPIPIKQMAICRKCKTAWIVSVLRNPISKRLSNQD